MSLGDSLDKALLESAIPSLRKVHSTAINEVSRDKLVVATFGMASAVYSKSTLAASAQLISTLTFSSKLSVNTRFCKGTPNPKNLEYRLTNTLQRRREEDK